MIYVFDFSARYSPTDFFVPAHATGEGTYRALFFDRRFLLRRAGSRRS